VFALAGGSPNMTTERRKAPRKKIKYIQKIGSWGKYEYVHHLVCGHVETRKRKAPTSEIACVICLKTEEKKQEIRALSRISPLISGNEDYLINEELKIERARGLLGAKFGIPLDAVDISSEYFDGKLIIRGATIYLSSQDVDKLTKIN
jgi:hypothetical protein